MSLDKLLNQVKATGKDQSVGSSGGGEYTPPEKGTTGLRLVGYYEVGQHESTWEGKTSTKNIVQLVWELVGKKHPPRVLDDGTTIPTRMTTEHTLSDHVKSGFFQLFSKLRTEETHFVELLGKAFMGDVIHKLSKAGKTYAKLDVSTIKKPIYLGPSDPTDADSELIEKPYPVGPAVTAPNGFVWPIADAEQWDSIKIDGEYAERKNEKGEVVSPARSKNVIQLKIASAKNFKGLPCYDYAASSLAGDGKITKEDTKELAEAIGDVDKAPATVEADPEDPMAGIG